MVYDTKEFLYLKPKHSYLQTFKATAGKPIYPVAPKQSTRQPPPAEVAATTRNNSLWSLLKPYFKEYCSNTSIHCFRYFADNKLKYYEKYLMN